ncbi:hypothetical protein AVEN_137590-1 [Araneus ventricosus]|uniref:Uncharacterized protein n=1 Tax=Araneus ventricosus TaxID=182803 RepID=A0A4Y2CWQ0_ARAVE|nr:hypothetical protein AVEN_137590-1 [Araneus ventricosus]
MEDAVEYSAKDEKKFSEDTPLVVDILNEGRSEHFLQPSSETIELTSRPEVIKPKGDANIMPRKSSPQKEVFIQLEPSLTEKLAKKRATADELEDKLQKLSFSFKGKLQSVDRIKQELKDQETDLLHSVQKIEGYIRQIYSLKREADDTFERLKSTSIQQALDFSILAREYDYVHTKKGAAIVILKYHRPAQSWLRSAICDLSQYNSVKDLVEYYLVLKLLRKDLLEEDKRGLEEAQRYSDEQKSIGQRARNLPLDILAKEEALYKTKSEIKEMRLKNIELERQVSNLLSSKAKEDMTWHDIKRWISKTCKSTCEIITPDSSEPKDSVVYQLQVLQDFVVMGNKIVERLHKEV